jgi:hypothetical protein
MLERSNVFPLPSYAEPDESTIEDLVGPKMYFGLVDLSYRVRRRRRLSRTVEIVPGEPVLTTVYNAFGAEPPGRANFDPLIPAEYLFRWSSRKIERLPGYADALTRFERLFANVNGAL